MLGKDARRRNRLRDVRQFLQRFFPVLDKTRHKFFRQALCGILLSRSLVVAFTATRDNASPAISAIRARMASRQGPIFGRSQISVTSRWAMRPPRAVTRSTAYFRNWSD